MDIDVKLVQILAWKYGYLNEITAENLNRPFVKALLQYKAVLLNDTEMTLKWH